MPVEITGRRRLAHLAEAAVVQLTEGCAAILLAAEVVLLLVGVIARYVFSHSLTWTDSLSSLLFLWLVMLSAVVALHRNGHMRMTAFTNAAAPRWRAFLDGIAIVAPIAFLLLMIGPACHYVAEESALTDPALSISEGWRAAAMPVGTALMILVALIRLVRFPDRRASATAVILVGALAGVLVLLQPMLENLDNLNLLIFFVGGIGLGVFSGVPIAFSFGLAAIGYLALTTDLPRLVMASRMDQGMSQIVLLAVPLFVLLGLLMEMTDMARALVSFLANLVGHFPGGLSYVLIAGMYLVSGISGSKSADMAALAPVLFPEMTRRNVPPGEFVALLSATAAQTETIPPSLVLIILGSVTNISIGALFTGGLLPGFVVGVMLCFVVWWRSRRTRQGVARRVGRREMLRSLRIALPALALPLVIRFCVVDGVTTATEVSTVGIVYSALAGVLIYRRFDLRRVWPVLKSAASLTGAILFIIGGATSVAWCLTQSGFADALADMFENLPGGKLAFVVASISVFVVLGSLLEGIPAIVLFGPLLFPIAQRLSVNPIHYAMIAVLAMGIGLFSPPFGVGYYTACAINGVEPADGIRPILGYLAALILGLIAVAAIPWISVGFL